MLTIGEKKKEIVACIINGNLTKSKMHQPEELIEGILKHQCTSRFVRATPQV